MNQDHYVCKIKSLFQMQNAPKKKRLRERRYAAFKFLAHKMKFSKKSRIELKRMAVLIISILAAAFFLFMISRILSDVFTPK